MKRILFFCKLKVCGTKILFLYHHILIYEEEFFKELNFVKRIYSNDVSPDHKPTDERFSGKKSDNNVGI